MIQDARQTEHDARELAAAKARLRSAARRHTHSSGAPPSSPKQAAAQLAVDNPGATAAVAFAAVAAVGPGRLFRMATFAFRVAPLGVVAWRAIRADHSADAPPPSGEGDLS